MTVTHPDGSWQVHREVSLYAAAIRFDEEVAKILERYAGDRWYSSFEGSVITGLDLSRFRRHARSLGLGVKDSRFGKGYSFTTADIVRVLRRPTRRGGWPDQNVKHDPTPEEVSEVLEKYGHLFTPAQRRAFEMRYREPRRAYSEIARDMGMTRQNVQQLVGKAWAAIGRSEGS